MAYWYIDATNRGRLAWRSCNPPNPIGSASFCVLERADLAASTISNRQYAQDRAARWLSGTHQCQWAGITCLPNDSIDRIELSKLLLLVCCRYILCVCVCLTKLFLLTLVCEKDGHGIQATLPSELGLLRNDQRLQLIFNVPGTTFAV